MALQYTGVENHGGLLRIWFMYLDKKPPIFYRIEGYSLRYES
ncbi:hypothetical protein SPM24T3_01753 [Serratia sp. M24T3]|nr:hypothetical protein SPM24T3_01753 [Serratia sp. M24T3]